MVQRYGGNGGLAGGIHMKIKSRRYGVEERVQPYPSVQFWYKINDQGDCVCHREGDLPAYIKDNGYQAWILNDKEVRFKR